MAIPAAARPVSGRGRRAADHGLADAARALAAPVCLNILSGHVAHKTKVGGVGLNLDGIAAVRHAAAAMLDMVRLCRPDASIGFVVGPMLTGGVKCIAGAHPDLVFGLLVVVGIGGAGVKLLKNVAWRQPPRSARRKRRRWCGR